MKKPTTWCRDNERTRSTTRSEWDEDAEMDVRSDKEGYASDEEEEEETDDNCI